MATLEQRRERDELVEQFRTFRKTEDAGVSTLQSAYLQLRNIFRQVDDTSLPLAEQNQIKSELQSAYDTFKSDIQAGLDSLPADLS